MSLKEQLIAAFQQLPENVTWEEAEETFRRLQAIDEADAEIDAGKFIAHEDVVRQFETWLRK